MYTDNISSEFTSAYDKSGVFQYGSKLPEIRDFNRLECLQSEGSTCEGYRWEYCCRVYFVKRLKHKFLGSSRHIHAFEKEFELGSRLSHPSLPHYVDFVNNSKECYIVMDFIDGKTLKELKYSSEMKSPSLIYKVIHQLIEVIEYLHRNNVLHYDIILENVMLTNGLHNVLLIDLDKSFNSAFTKTSGDPSRFGVDNPTQPSLEVDYRAIANIIRSFVSNSTEMKHLIDLCEKPDIMPDELREALCSLYGDVIVSNLMFSKGVSCDGYIGYYKLDTFVVKILKPQLLNNKHYRNNFLREYELMSKFQFLSYYPKYKLLRDTPQECFILIEKPKGMRLSEILENKHEWLNDKFFIKGLLYEIWEAFMALYRAGMDNISYDTEDIYLDTNQKNVCFVNLREILDVAITEDEYLPSDKNIKSDRCGSDKSNGIKLPGICKIIDAMRKAGVNMNGINGFYQACREGSSVSEMSNLLDDYISDLLLY